MKAFLRRLIANVAPPTSMSADGSENTDPNEIIIQGHALEDAGDVAGALKVYRQAVSVAPESPKAQLNLGNALKLLGRFDEARAAFEASIELNPEYAEGYMNLGSLHLEQESFSKAESSYRKALGFRPDWLELNFAMGSALRGLERLPEAREVFESVLLLNPRHGKAAASLAGLLASQGETKDALSVLRKALEVDHGNLHVNMALAEIAKTIGDSELVVDAYRAALHADPGNRALFSAYLFALNFLPKIGNDEILSEHKDYAARFAVDSSQDWPAIRLDPRKKLRVGYVSSDFRRHSVSCFFEPLLTYHDRATFEVVCYYNHATRDAITERFESLSDAWCDIVGMSDKAVDGRIRDDEIDILVDLNGHTTGNRLGVFAKMPAPIQFTWLGYLCTTGLEAMDYRLCDRHTDHIDIAELWQVEKPARLPDSQWCYQPQVTIPDVSALPRIHNGYWTFGSFNQASKLNSIVVDAWGSALAAIPNSRIRIFGVADSLHEERIRQGMAQHGIGDDRLDIVGRIDIDSYFNAYRDVDIALDTFPYNGATTTCDALIMGVPVATVAGDRPITRGGLSLLSSLGLNEWVADSVEALGAMLQRQVRDPEFVAKLRSSLPERMRTSVLMDGERFSKGIEAIYRNAWQKKCED